MLRFAAVFLAIASVAGLAACGEPGPTEAASPIALPSPIREARTVAQPNGQIRIEAVSARVGANQPYRYSAFTHCGFVANTFDFDGSFWAIADAPAAFAPALNGPNPPDGIGNPSDGGVIVLIRPDRAVWTSQRGIQLTLARGPGEVTVFGCD